LKRSHAETRQGWLHALSATRDLRLASLVPFSLHAEARLDILAACNRPGCILDAIAQSSAANGGPCLLLHIL
jgi:hypothetical protein